MALTSSQIDLMTLAGMQEPWHLQNLESQISRAGGPTWNKYAGALGVPVQKKTAGHEGTSIITQPPESTLTPGGSEVAGNLDQVVDLTGVGLPKADQNFQATLDTLTGMLPQYQQSVDFMAGIPGMIDDWAEDEVKKARVHGDDIAKALSDAANMRAGRGIMGGTEDDNLRAKLLGQVQKRVMDKRSEAREKALLAKTSVGPAITQETRSSVALLSNLFGMSTEANINVANLIARLIESGYTG